MGKEKEKKVHGDEGTTIRVGGHELSDQKGDSNDDAKMI